MREKLIELLTNSPQLDVLDWTTGWEQAANYLIANGVTIPVRCKGCKHWDEYHIGSLEGPGMGDGICVEDPHNWIDHKKADDFCSYGERKDNDL